MEQQIQRAEVEKMGLLKVKDQGGRDIYYTSSKQPQQQQHACK